MAEGPTGGGRRDIRSVLARMAKLGIRKEDLQEDFVRGSGPGGQKINKTSSTVVLRHLPSGFEVRCQEERSLAMNRVTARLELCAKIEARREQIRLANAAETAKKRALNRKRSGRQKAKLVKEKRQRGQTKALRRKPGRGED
jgi:peptide chain release factor